jgi:plastocyanin
MVLMVKPFALLMLLLIVALSGCTEEKPEPVINTTVNQTPQPIITPMFTVPEPSTVYVEIKGSAFNPAVLTITNGTTVRWTNLDSAPHAINGKNFSSPPLNKREMWNYTFNRSGTFEYNCSIHPASAKGRIIVE